MKQASFVAFDDAFFGFLGQEPKFEVAYAFPAGEDKHVHEAPVFVEETNELVFADTSVEGWLFGLNVETFQVQSILL